MIQLQQFDVGVPLTVKLRDRSGPIDPTGFSGIAFLLEPPTGPLKVRAGIPGVDADTTGEVQYTTQLGDLDEVGTWRIQVRLDGPDGPIRSRVGTFAVLANVEEPDRFLEVGAATASASAWSPSTAEG